MSFCLQLGNAKSNPVVGRMLGLDRIGLATYKKPDLTSPVQAVFSKFLAVHNKSEKPQKKLEPCLIKIKVTRPKPLKGWPVVNHNLQNG